MNFIRDALPYILVVGGFLLPLFTLLKEWKEYENSKLRRAVLIVLCVITVLSLAALRQDNEDKEQAKRRAAALGQEISSLQGQVTAFSKAQADNTTQFLRSFNDISQKVARLQTEVTTEALQTKLAKLQAELQTTQKALAAPKTSLTFTFYPFEKGQQPITDVVLPVDSNGSVHVQFAIMNTTRIDALDGGVNLVICDECKFSTEPSGFTKLQGEGATERYMTFEHILAQTMVVEAADVIPPKKAFQFDFGIQYRCRTCRIPSHPILGTVRLQREFLKYDR